MSDTETKVGLITNEYSSIEKVRLFGEGEEII